MPFKKLRFLLFVLLAAFHFGKAQTNLKIINQSKEFRASILSNPKLSLLELKTLVPHIRYDLKYATTNNFTGVQLYPSNTTDTYLRKEPAEALAKVATTLAGMGLGITVWDAYRPHHVTVKFWELIKDERYVAHPAKGSGHNRGIAIDMTLYDLKTGANLEMPTGFDDFSEIAHHGFEGISAKQKQNRELLKAVMEKNGFIPFQTEWWHFYWPNGEEYDVLDYSFEQIKKMNSVASK
ncbi:MAG: hypothetical protein RL642_1387 [Bacteroidota bacterium]